MRKVLFFLIVFVVLGVSCGKTKENPNSGFEFASEGNGCCSFVVYKVNNRNDFVISVQGSRDNLELSNEQQIFDLSNTNNNDLKVEVHKYTSDALKNYCNQGWYRGSSNISDSWTGKSGMVKIKLPESTTESELRENLYRIDIILENINLKNEKGGKIFVEYLEFKDVLVGSCPD